MIWNSLGDFIAMGGYGFYVWGSYLVTVFLILAEIGLLSRRCRAARRARRIQATLVEGGS